MMKNTKCQHWSILVNAGQRRSDRGQNASKYRPNHGPKRGQRGQGGGDVIAGVTGLGRGSGSTNGSTGRIRFGSDVPRVWPLSGSNPGSAAIGSDGPCENTRTLGFSKRPKRRRLGALFKAPFSFFFILFYFSSPFRNSAQIFLEREALVSL